MPDLTRGLRAALLVNWVDLCKIEFDERTLLSVLGERKDLGEYCKNIQFRLIHGVLRYPILR
jgi:hypothetical protein